MSVFIPTIDFQQYDEKDDAALEGLASQVSEALTRSGVHEDYESGNYIGAD